MTKCVVIGIIINILALNAQPTQQRWGQIGHRTVGEIAEQYLTIEARKEVQRVLGKQSLAEVSTWMDEVRADEAYDYMETWHYVTLPAGESYDTVEKEESGDIIWAIRKMSAELKQNELTPTEEAEHLKVLVHLVGDIHQPLHVGNGTDRGGNDVRLQWFWSNSNLHRVWDSEMIDDKQLSFTELARFVDKADSTQVQEWQRASVLEWADESRNLLPQVYDLPEDKELSYDYAYHNWNTVQHRLLQAGIRLAGLLNEIYSE